MAKDRSFAAKVSKAHGAGGSHCATCGEAFSTLKVVSTQENAEKKSLRFKETLVSICKCNENEYMS